LCSCFSTSSESQITSESVIEFGFGLLLST
jgi:hypothetical protein